MYVISWCRGVVHEISWYRACNVMHGIVHVHVISWYRACYIMVSCMLYNYIV